jgi:hypothetical protein
MYWVFEVSKCALGLSSQGHSTCSSTSWFLEILSPTALNLSSYCSCADHCGASAGGFFL